MAKLDLRPVLDIKPLDLRPVGLIPAEIPSVQESRPYDPSEPPMKGKGPTNLPLEIIQTYQGLSEGLNVPFERLSQAVVAPLAKAGQVAAPDIRNLLDYYATKRQAQANVEPLEYPQEHRKEFERLRKLAPYEKPDRTAAKELPKTLLSAGKALIPAPGMTEGAEPAREIFNKTYKEISGSDPPEWYGDVMDFASTVVAIHGLQEGIKFISGFTKGIKGKPQPQVRAARTEVDKALKIYKETGDRTAWDAVRTKYAGLKPEAVRRAAPPEVKDFGKYPLSKAVEPTREVPAVSEILKRPPEAKQPWEMSFAEYRNMKLDTMKNLEPDIRATIADKERPIHKAVVAIAVQENKPVPRSVLEEYKSEPWAKEALAKGEGEIEYAKGVLQNNVFPEGELDYMMGLTDKKPHGIEQAIWKKAAKEIGFARENLVETDGKFYLKSQPAPAAEGAKAEKPPTIEDIEKELGLPQAKRKLSGKGFVDLTPLADAGVQARTTLGKVGKTITRFTDVTPDVKKVLIDWEEQMKYLPVEISKQQADIYGNLSKVEEDILRRHGEYPGKVDLPEHLAPLAAGIEATEREIAAGLEELGYPADWPNRYREGLQKRLAKLESREEPDIMEIAAVEQAIKEAEGLEYMHHYFQKRSLSKRISSYFSKTISKRPSGLLGRKIPSYEKAKEFGLEPAPIAVQQAHAIYSLRRAQETANLIKAINENPNLSMPADKAPEDWVYLDENIFPESVQRLSYIEDDKVRHITRKRKYPEPIADALAELTYARSPNLLVRWYDKFNYAMKLIGFYNPLYMTKNDFVQGWRAAGIKYATKLPQALETFINKDAKYHALRRMGLFNNAVNWTPSVVELTQHHLDLIRKSFGERTAEKLGKWINPVNLIKNMQEFNNKTTWNVDEIMRIACYDAIKNTPMTKGMTDYEVVELANDFMVNYAKLPKGTKQALNKVFFVPTYRIGNQRVWWGRVMKEPDRFKGPLLRTVAYKMFVTFGLAALAKSFVEWTTKKTNDNIRVEKGYRLVIPNQATGQDMVYVLSDPLLEGAKVTQRPVRQSLELNLAALPSLLLRVLGGPKGFNTRDPFGEFFKLGTPFVRDIMNWTDPDKETHQKILTQLGIAYTYSRKLRPDEQDKRITADAIARALSIWTDWTAQKKDVEKMLGRPIYRLMSDEELESAIKENTIKRPSADYENRRIRIPGQPRKGQEKHLEALKKEQARRRRKQYEQLMNR